MLFKKKKKIVIYAPISGIIVALDNVSDEVFAERMVGDGVAIQPKENENVVKVCAVLDGVLEQIFPTLHAFSMSDTVGLELFVHIGINTVSLDGKCFTALSKDGNTVKIKEPILSVDMVELKNLGFETVTPVIVSNIEDYQGIELLVNPGETIECGAPLYEILI